MAEDAGTEALITIEDDGVGMDPELLRRLLAGDDIGDSVGLANVDERLRTVFGPEYGLVVETGPQSGTKVSVRVPKFRAGVRATRWGTGRARRLRGSIESGGGEHMRVLVVDDEQPAVDDLVYLLSNEPGVGDVTGVLDATAALRHLQEHEVDIVFLDIKMPGLDGLELARLLSRFARPPSIVFVTAYDEHAVEAFELRATDYLLKPVRPERLRQALDRSQRIDDGEPYTSGISGQSEAQTPPGSSPLSVMAVESGGRIRFVERDSVAWVEARGDYVRLHGTGSGVPLVRVAMSTLEEAWGPSGFFRIHRGYLVSLRRVEEVRMEVGRGCLVRRRTVPSCR